MPMYGRPSVQHGCIAQDHCYVNPGLTLSPDSLPGVKHFITRALQNLANAHDAIIESHICQMHHANHHQHEDDSFVVGDLVYVSMADLSLPKGRVMELLLKYIGPFKVLEAHLSMSSYRVVICLHFPMGEKCIVIC